MGTKHTPGPWKAEGFKGLVVNDSRGITLALCPGDVRADGVDTVQANARLIAAAPALLEALRECVTDDGAFCMTDESRNSAHHCRRRLDEISRVARAAIAQATGQDGDA